MFDAARPRRRTRRASARRSARPCARSSTAPSWRSRCAAPAPRTSPGCARSCPPARPLLYVPYLFQRSHGARATRQVAEHLGEELGLLMARRKQRRRRPGSHRAAARGQGDRHPLRLGRRRQDDHGGGGRPRWRPCTTAARCSCSPSTRPGGWPTRSGLEAFGNVETQVPPRGVRRGRRRAPRRAVGGDARHQAELGRPRPPPRARRRHPRRDPRQPALQEHHRPVRAEPRLHRDGAALRDPRVGHATT